MKHFIITVDTEGDNLWSWKKGMPITTKNSKYIPRFQELCEIYHFFPVYLIDYEMINDDGFMSFVIEKSKARKCEIGVHIHAWNSPPNYELPNRFGGNAYITEYPIEIQREKIAFLKSLIQERTGVDPVVFRSGRWATDQKLYSILNELGFLVDCSVTPGITHFSNKGLSVRHGSNHIKESRNIHRLTGRLIEIPMTTARIKSFTGVTIKNRVRNLIKGKDIWLRPATNSAEEMIALIKDVENQKIDYLELMIHSSELMPGGSPYTKDKEAIESFYLKLESIFQYISKDYKGVLVRDLYSIVYSEC